MKYTKEELGEIALKLITQANVTKTFAIEAINSAKKGDFNLAEKNLDKANKNLLLCQKQHTALIQEEAAGDEITISLLITHALDQVNSAETVLLLSTELVSFYMR